MTHVFSIGDRLVGEGHPCFIIAEAGVNHNGDVEMAFKLVDAAVEAGADAVKFQKRDLQHLYSEDLLANPNSAEWAFQYMISFLKQAELSDDEFRQVEAYCQQKGIRFMCTPWDKPSLDFLETLSIEAYKVASADLVNFPLLEQIAATGKPMILSSGMATLDEIAATVEFLNGINATFSILHCVSTYPAPFESLNLRFIDTLKQFDIPVGYSGHERGIVMPVVAVSLGACIIEKHITLDRTLPGPDHAASLEPQGFDRMVRDIRNTEIALGNAEKQLAHMEMMNRQVLRKSLIAVHDLEAGTVITREMVGVKGPGKGLSPQQLPDLLGVTLQRNMKTDDYFVDADLQTHHVKSRIDASNLRRTWGLKARFHDLYTILEQKPQLVELHFSEEDVNHAFAAPSEPYPQQLFIHAPEFANQRLLNMSAEDDETRETARALIQRTIDKAVEMQPYFAGGTVGVVIHVGGMTMDEPTEANDIYLRRAIDTFRQLDPKGLILLPENLPPRPWYFGGQWHQNIFIRAEEMVEFCQETGHGMTLDISHAQLYCNYYNVSLADFTRLCLPYTRHLHFADARGIDEEGLQVGDGVVDWDELLALLAKEDFSWVPEIWNGHLNNFEPFIIAVNRLAGYKVL